MASFSKGTSFTDGVTGDVTAAKLHALVDAATPVAGLVTDRTAETTVASGDQVLIADASDSNTLKKMTVTNLFKTDVSITSGTGTAGTVAIGPTGDTNTGLFFPAADTIAFSEGGTEAMRIDSSGNVGIGANSPTFGSGSGVELSRSGVATFRVTSGGQGVEFRNNAGSAEIDTRGAYPIILSTNQTERLRIDSSGRVGIGTTSPATTYRMSLTGDGSTIVGGLSLTSAGITYIGAPAANSSAFEIWNAADNYVRIGTNATERLRITSGGNVGINITNPAEKFVVLESGNTFNCAKFNLSASSGFLYGPWINFSGQAPNNNNSYFLYCNDTANEKCIIYATGTISNRTGTYNSLSDLKAKQDISSSLSQWNDIKALRVVKYRLKDEVAADPNYPYYIGLIAQEVEQISPHLVDQSPDYENVEVVGEDGNTRTERRHTGTFTKSVKTSILYMKAVKALQEAMERIEQLESKVAALEAA